MHMEVWDVRHTYGYASVDMRIFGHEVSDNREGLIILVVDAKEHLVGWVLLGKCGFQVLVKVRF